MVTPGDTIFIHRRFLLIPFECPPQLLLSHLFPLLARAESAQYQKNSYSIALCIRVSSSFFCFILMRCSCCACCRASSCSLYWFSSASLRILLARSCSFFNFILSILSASSSGVSFGCTSVNSEFQRSIPLQYLRLRDD